MNIYSIIKDKYHKINYNIKLTNFYLQNDSSQQQSYVSILLDSFFSKIALFGISYLWFVYRTHKIFLSLVLSIIITFLVNYALYLFKRRKFEEKRIEKRKQIAKEFVLDQINKLSSEEFKWHFMKLLLRLPSIGSIKNVNDYILTTLNKKPIAIGFYHNPGNNNVTGRMVNRLINDALLEGINKAIYITTGTYDEECSKAAAKKSNFRLYLLEDKDLLELMERAGMTTDDETIDEIIYNRITRETNSIRLKEKLLKPERCKTYIGYALILFAMSFINRFYSVYYSLLAIGFLILAGVTYSHNIKEPYTEKDNLYVLDELTLKKR